MWTQQYDPMGYWPLSTLLAALPVLILLGLLASGRVAAWQAALCGLLTAAGMAAGPFGMPIDLVVASTGVGIVFALFRIVWLILSTIFLYDLAVMTSQFDVMRASIARLSGDRRVQAVLVAFSFGAFLEGAAGFCVPVAISAAFLVGLGFEPFRAALLCLIANTAPVAWGALGVPLKTLSVVTDLDVEALSATSGRILPLLSVVIPFWLVMTMVGWCATRPVWPALLVIGGTFAAVQFLWSNFVGFELVDIISAVSSLVAGVVLLRFWKPREEWRFPHDADVTEGAAAQAALASELKRGQVVRAWTPFALLTLAVLFWGTPAVKKWMDAHTTWKIELARLHLKVAKGEAVTGHKTPEPKDRDTAVLEIVPVSATGTGVFLAAIISGLFLGVSPATMAATLAADGAPDGPGVRRDLLYAGARVRDQVFGVGHRARPCVHPHRPVALSPVRDVARLGRGRPDRLRHVEQRPVRQPSEDHGEEVGAERDPHGVGQHDGRGHGEDDRRAVDRRGRRRHGRRG